MNETAIRLENVSVQSGSVRVLDQINWEIGRKERWVITGASGSGKTTLARVITGGLHFTGSLKNTVGPSLLVGQQHHFKNLSNTDTFYYQQRFNAADAGDSVDVRQYLGEVAADDAGLLDRLEVIPLLDKPLIQLSNGENKRVQIVSALLQHPSVLILDNPFTGLDKTGRESLHRIIDELATGSLLLLLIVPSYEIPESATHVAVLEKGRLVYAGRRDAADEALLHRSNDPVAHFIDKAKLAVVLPPVDPLFRDAIRMVDVNVRYGDRTILQSINWTVKAGERWNISGPNGSGKSTLLSLVSGDNPQAYANEIYLFDKRRGTGESIWDIKKNIGFLSPELHLFFDSSSSCFDVVASGLFDTIGLFRQLSVEQAELTNTFIEAFGLGAVRHKLLFNLSLGQQRMVLLVRALIKNPPLLILDEPCQGLDEGQAQQIRELVDHICSGGTRTLLYVSHYSRDIPGCVDRYFDVMCHI